MSEIPDARNAFVSSIGRLRVLVARVYPEGMDPCAARFWHRLNRVTFANLPATEAVSFWMRRVQRELARLSQWRLSFEPTSISDWRALPYDPRPENWLRIVEGAIGEGNPAGYEIAIILKPFRTGVPAWDEMFIDDNGIPYLGWAYWNAPFRCIVLSSDALSKWQSPGYDAGIAIHEIGHLLGLEHHNEGEEGYGRCVMGPCGPYSAYLCGQCLRKLGWT